MGGTAQSCVAFAFAGYRLPATNHFGVFRVLTVNRPNNKKRPELLSSGRHGSPPPELPNYEMDSKARAEGCKRN
jgi:hypothetical protein